MDVSTENFAYRAKLAAMKETRKTRTPPLANPNYEEEDRQIPMRDEFYTKIRLLSQISREDTSRGQVLYILKDSLLQPTTNLSFSSTTTQGQSLLLVTVYERDYEKALDLHNAT